MNNEYNIDSFDYIISDTHFLHNNIVKYAMRPGYDSRGYGNHNFNKHNELMLENWLSVVAPNETILHLGDVAMGKKEEFRDFAQQLTGNKFMLLGNHDGWGTDFYGELGFTVIDPFYIHRDGWDILFSHYPKQNLQKREANVHGHLHINPCDHLTRRHKNVSVEVMAYSPQPFKEIVKDVVYNSNNNSAANFRQSYMPKIGKRG